MPSYEILCHLCKSTAIGTYSTKGQLTEAELARFSSAGLCASCSAGKAVELNARKIVEDNARKAATDAFNALPEEDKARIRSEKAAAKEALLQPTLKIKASK